VSTPSFIAFSECRPFITGKRVVIVGSGPGAVLNAIGFIDSHDVVVRVNNYGHHSNLGNRTDVFYSFFGGSIKKTREELIGDGVRLCMCKCPDAKPIESRWHEQNGRERGVDFHYIYEDRKDFWFCPTFVPDSLHFLQGFKLLGNHVPTTGFSAILDIAALQPKSLHLTGFDFFSSGIHNLNQAWRPGDPRDPIGHVPEREAEYLRLALQAKTWPFPVTMDAAMRKAMEAIR